MMTYQIDIQTDTTISPVKRQLEISLFQKQIFVLTYSNLQLNAKEICI